MRMRLGTIVWLVIGVILAASHHYLTNINGVRTVISALLAILLWPLMLLGISLHVH